MLELGGGRLQEVAARGDVVKQVADGDRGAVGRGTRFIRRHHAPFDADERPGVGVDLFGAQLDVSNRRDRGERLAAEAERSDTLEIRGVLNLDRKSTRLNSSHVAISYAVFCLK